MNKQSLDERIKLLRSLSDEMSDTTFGKEVRTLLGDVITKVTPEKVTDDEGDTDERFHINLGYNDAIDQVHSKANKLLSKE